jgi:anti-sigma B factor antagonist
VGRASFPGRRRRAVQTPDGEADDGGVSIRCDEHNGVCLVTVDGDLAGGRADEARQAVEALLARAAGGVVFDLGRCGFIDSAGLELLCRVRRRCDERGGRMALSRVGAGCAKILQITRLAGRFDCHADLNRALAAAR